MDVENTFLNGDLQEEIYMCLLPRNDCPLNKVCQLQRVLYDLKHPSWAQFVKFSTTMEHLGFASSPHDSALFIQKTTKGIILLLLYVDYMIIISYDHSGISDLEKSLNQNFKMKELGALRDFVGLKVSSNPGGYYLRRKYAYDLFSCIGMIDSKVTSTPLEANVRLTPNDGTLLKDATLYRQLVSGLIYLTVT